MNVPMPRWAIPFAKPGRYKTAYGGRSSGKTWTFAHMIVARAAMAKTRVACGREFQSSIKVSAKPALEIAINRLGLASQFDIQEQAIRHENGSSFFFRGLERNRDEIRGWEDVDIVWIEEAQRLSHETAQILIPTIRKSGSELWFSWNPKNRTDWVYRRFITHPRESDVTCKVNWNDNPWMPDEANEERLADKRDNPDMYSHIWEGEPDDEGAERKVLPYSMLQDCVEAHRQGLHENAGLIECGLDIADSSVGDWNAMVARRGSVIYFADRWRAKVIGDTARRADAFATGEGVVRLFYDAQGVGAGVRSHFAEMKSRRYAARPEMFGGAVKGKDSRFSYRVSNNDFFARRNSQLGWTLRLRAQNTKKLMMGEEVRPADCLFIDHTMKNLDELLAQLSQPTWRESTTGKIELIKRDEAEESPDIYDAAVLAFAQCSIYGLKAR